MEKSQIQTENQADIKAAERMAKLYDEIIRIEENAIKDQVFCMRLISSSRVCYSASLQKILKYLVKANLLARSPRIHNWMGVT